MRLPTNQQPNFLVSNVRSQSKNPTLSQNGRRPVAARQNTPNGAQLEDIRVPGNLLSRSEHESFSVTRVSDENGSVARNPLVSFRPTTTNSPQPEPDSSTQPPNGNSHAISDEVTVIPVAPPTDSDSGRPSLPQVSSVMTLSDSVIPSPTASATEAASSGQSCVSSSTSPPRDSRAQRRPADQVATSDSRASSPPPKKLIKVRLCFEITRMKL